MAVAVAVSETGRMNHGRPTSGALTHDPAGDFRAKWSPDGREVAFESDRTGDHEIWIVPVEGGSPRQLTRSGGHLLDWSPEGKWIYFLSPRSGQREVWRIPTEGGEASPVTLLRSGDPLFSQDTQAIYLTQVDDTARVRLFQAPINGGSERLVADLDPRPGTFGGLKATDGRFLYFTWHQTFSDIWVMDIVDSDD